MEKGLAMSEKSQEKASAKKRSPIRYVNATGSALLVAWFSGLFRSRKLLPCALVAWLAAFCFISACYYDDDQPIKEGDRVVRFFGGIALLVLLYLLVSNGT